MPPSPPPSSPSPSSQPPPHGDDRPSASSSSSSGEASTSSEVHEEEEDNLDEGESDSGQTGALIRQRSSYPLRPYFLSRWWQRQSPEEQETNSWFVREDTWSCIIVMLTFWFFVSLTLIMGIYGSETIELSPYTSILLQPNPLFVQYVKVEKSDGRKSAAVLYGMYKTPILNNFKTWLENMNVSMEIHSIKQWGFFLNKGSELNIYYSVKSSSSLMLIIAQGEEEMAEWLQDPSYPSSTLSWNVIHGSGVIKQEIPKSSYYYVAVGNLNIEVMEVTSISYYTILDQIELKLEIRSSIYDTSDAYYKCSVAHGLCNLKVLFPRGNAAILSSPDVQEGIPREKLYVELSYEPRWITYFVGIGGMTLLMFLAFNILSKFQSEDEIRNGTRAVGLESERAPLLTPKDDDASSLGSSYDSDPNSDEENLDDVEAKLYEGKAVGDGQSSNVIRQLCVICFDAPRDCFFLPCGHCATCYECASRIAEAAGTCPICRRTMKKIRKIFSV
ncbi:hypothetical protein V2J09_018568 [Rumex salicifolius]